MPASPYFIVPYTALDRPRMTVCQINGEHDGDPTTTWAADRCTAIETWTCCGEVTVVGEYIDCDTCGDPGIAYTGTDRPTGWVEDSNGNHCPRCQPGGTP